MKYTIETNRFFRNTSIFTSHNHIVVSPFSYKIRNLGEKRWKLKYRGKIFYKTNVELDRIMKGTLGYSNPKVLVSFSVNKKRFRFSAILRNMTFHTESNLKNHRKKKHYLFFYLDPINKDINVNFNKVNRTNITFVNKILKPPRYQYGYCDGDRWKPCKVTDYLGKTKYFQGHVQDISFCKPFDHHKGPFNIYCANST